MANFTLENTIAQSTSLTNQFGASPGVNAGDLIVFFVRLAGSTGCTISDGTSSLTMTSVFSASGGTSFQIGYLLSSVATGNPTYTLNSQASKIAAYQFRPSGGTVSLGVALSAGGTTGANPSTGNISTSGIDLVIAMIGNSNFATSAWKIGGATATGNVLLTSNAYNAGWYTLYSTAQTNINASCTLGTANAGMGIMAFLLTPSGGGANWLTEGYWQANPYNQKCLDMPRDGRFKDARSKFARKWRKQNDLYVPELIAA